MKKNLILLAIMMLFAQSFSQASDCTDNIQSQSTQKGYKIINYNDKDQVSGWTINHPNKMESYDSKGNFVGCTKNGINKIINKNDNDEDLSWTVNLSNRIERYNKKGLLTGFTEKVGNKIINYNGAGIVVDSVIYSGNKITHTHYNNRGKIMNVTVNENK